MNARLILIVITLIFAAISVSAQEVPAGEEKLENQILKPTFIFGDIVFANKAMATIDIKGSEVDPFLQMQARLEGFINAAKEQEVTNTDSVTVQLTVAEANNLILFLERATLSGANAVRYKRFTDALRSSATALLEERKKKKPTGN
ncbi:MAG: hypothetical protein ACOC2K_04720 [Bacteroidota bacterium]